LNLLFLPPADFLLSFIRDWQSHLLFMPFRLHTNCLIPRPEAPGLTDTDTILKMPGLTDAALIAGLVAMVIISGYENFASHFDEGKKKLIDLASLIPARSRSGLLQPLSRFRRCICYGFS